jgi:uncharacterized protein YdeI (YjbR/CyaY-like superfamily)
MSAPKAKTESVQKRFRGKLESGLIPQDLSEGRYWVAIRMPFDPSRAWPERVGMRVRGTINGVAFRTSLFGSKTLGYLLMVNKTIQKQAKAGPGSTAEIVIEPDLEDRSADPPPELVKLFKADRAVKKWFDKLNHSMRKYICDAVAERKSAESRVRCAEQWVECLMLAMDGEIEVPPVLQFAFRRYPDANAGWDAMTPIQRRSQLLGIFQAQSPEARQKRADRAAAEAARVAGRRAGARSSGTGVSRSGTIEAGTFEPTTFESEISESGISESRTKARKANYHEMDWSE